MSVRFLSAAASVLAAALFLTAAGCTSARPAGSAVATPEAPFETLRPRLPTGARLDPAVEVRPAGPMPLGVAVAPGGTRVAMSLGGWSLQGVQIVDATTGAVVQTLPQLAAFVGVAFAPDGRTLWASGGNQDVVYRYDWDGAAAALRDSVVLAVKVPRRSGTRYPAGVGVSPDGRRLYVAENLADSLAVVDTETGRVVQRVATDRYPVNVVVALNGDVFVSAWGGQTVSALRPDARGGLAERGRWPVARHPSALLLSADGSRLFAASGSTDRVAVVDTETGAVVAELLDPAPGGPGEGSTPNALALSPDGLRLFVAEADNNAVAVFDLSAATSGVPAATGGDALAGRVPVGWYPTALALTPAGLVVASGKGLGTGPNPAYPQPGTSRGESFRTNYTLGQIEGGVSVLPDAMFTPAALAATSPRVAAANNWTAPRAAPAYPPFEHVVYIIKENRTYDQIFGDLPAGDGDTSLVFFPRPVSPNHHALAERFGLYDRFFVNAEVSPDGHNWSVGAYTTDYLQKTIPSNYSGRGRTYDYEGTNRGFGTAFIPEDDVAEPANGYLWDLAERAGITFRNYGEFVVPEGVDADGLPQGYRGTKPFLAANTDTRFPGYNLAIPDQVRADRYIAELDSFVARGEMPALEIVRLPNDHTAGARAGAPTPRAMVADNDLALGRIVEALSRSPFWATTVVFVVEDDAQNGPDHVDSHRTPFLVVSPYNRPGTVSRFTNTTDVLATIEGILGLGSLSQFDHFGRPLVGIWADTPDLRPVPALTPAVSLTELNVAGTPDARASEMLALDIEDVADEDLFNRILWRAARGARPYPGPTRMSALEAFRAR